MALYNRDGIWWIDIYHKGKRIRKSSGTEIKKDAQKLHDKLKAELWEQKALKYHPNKSWLDAVIRWFDESSHKRSIHKDKEHLAWVDPFLRKVKLSDIDKDLIDQIAAEKAKTGVSASTVNRMLEIIRAILNRAHKDWGWLETVPSIRLRTVENRRIRWLTKRQANQLLKELPPHLAAMAAFTLATGLRESNVTKLKWEEVDLVRCHALVHPDESKSKRAIPVPLNKQAITILAAQKGKHPAYVFTYRGHPVRRCNNHAWQKALKRAGINDFRWHDLRHTWASWHVQSGTSLHELQQLGGWANYEMVLRYAHLSSDHLKNAADRIDDTL